MKKQAWPLAGMLAFLSLAFGSAVHAECTNAMTLPTCVHTLALEDGPGFDLSNTCGNYGVTINATAASLEITFNLDQGERMSDQILSEIPDRDLEILTEAYKDGTLSLMCCPDFSQFTRCRPADLE